MQINLLLDPGGNKILPTPQVSHDQPCYTSSSRFYRHVRCHHWCIYCCSWSTPHSARSAHILFQQKVLPSHAGSIGLLLRDFRHLRGYKEVAPVLNRMQVSDLYRPTEPPLHSYEFSPSTITVGEIPCNPTWGTFGCHAYYRMDLR